MRQADAEAPSTDTPKGSSPESPHKAEGQRHHPGLGPPAQCSIPHTRWVLIHQRNLGCDFWVTTSHFSARRENGGTERLSAVPKATQQVGYRAKDSELNFLTPKPCAFCSNVPQCKRGA